jgi:tetratricopeptide (TPR) repeat protein
MRNTNGPFESSGQSVVVEPTRVSLPASSLRQARAKAKGQSMKRKVVMTSAVLAALALGASACSSAASPGTTTTSSNSPKQLLSAGISAQASGNLTAARNDYAAIIALDPQNHDGDNLYAYYNLGVIDQTQGNLAAAETEYESALQLNPKYLNAMYNLAVAETTTSPAAAIVEYRQLLKLKPKDINSTYNLGLLYYDAGKIAQGRALLRQAIALDPALKNKLPKNVKL